MVREIAHNCIFAEVGIKTIIQKPKNTSSTVTPTGPEKKRYTNSVDQFVYRITMVTAVKYQFLLQSFRHGYPELSSVRQRWGMCSK